MQTANYRRIRSLFLSTITIVVLIMAALFYWNSARELKIVISSAEKRSASYVNALNEHAERVFAQADNALATLIDEIDERGGISSVKSPVFYKLLKERATPFSSVYVVNSNADIISHSLAYKMNTVNLADRDYFRHHRDNPSSGLFISKPFKSKVSNTWRFSLSRPLRDSTGVFVGLISVTFETSYFEKFYKTIDAGSRGRIMLLSTSGDILVHAPFFEQVLETNLKNAPLFTKYLAATPSGTYQVDRAIMTKVPRIISYNKLVSFPVISVVSLDLKEITAPWVKSAYSQMLIGGLLLLLIGSMSYFFLQKVKTLEQVNIKLEEQQDELLLKSMLLDSASDAVLLLDSDAHFVYFNQALSQMTGYSADELHELGLPGIEPSEYAARIQDNFHELFQNGEVFIESAYRRKSGSIMPIEVHARILEVEGRQLVMSLVRDITERKDIEHELVNNIESLKKAEHREKIRSEILERLVSGEALTQLLSFIALSIEKEDSSMLCSILLVSDDGKRLLNGAAPSLPEAYNKATDRTRIGEGVGSCGTAAHRRERVVVEDIDDHPFWKGFVPAQEAGLRSCWSEPILSSNGQLLGTFAIYHRTPATPTESEISLIQQASAFAGIAIERSNSEAERLELQHLLSQSQKMEAIGHLSGGIAHDFNNLLTPILIYSDMLKRSMPDNDKAKSQLDGIIKASGKARDLTQQLLSFGRKQVMQMQVLDLNDIIMSFHSMLRRTLRESISLSLQLSSQPVVARVDSSKIEQVLLNLVLNAQDAIAANGSISIETGQVLIDDEFAKRLPGMNSGRFVLMSFTDNGCGMSPETMSRIFEPFFSTKEIGHGTGLGLANVYGIVKQHNGYIMAVSTVGVGTTFKIYIPLSYELPLIEGNEKEQTDLDHSGSAVILLVEDNEMVRVMSKDLLEGLGYTVYSADHPDRALELVVEVAEKIDLVITDVVMPGMNGQQLFEQITAARPEIDKVLYMSGYTNNVIVTDGELDDGLHFLQKPFTVDALMAKVKKLLQPDC